MTMHTARWDHSVDLHGKRVAVIGTGASAIQVIPAIAPEVAQLTVFQRTPIWCLPKLDAPLSPRARRVLRSVPGAELAARWASQAFVEVTFVLAAHFAGTFPSLTARGEGAARKMLREVTDPVVRGKLTPQYSLGCKRPSFSNEYIPAFNREQRAARNRRHRGDHTDGRSHDRGGRASASTCWSSPRDSRCSSRGTCRPFEMLGTDGIRLEEWWDTNRLQAYEGVSVPGFPNSFSILGPYGFNGQSYFGLIETQMRHIVRCLKRARRDRATRVEITPGGQPPLLRVDARAKAQPGLLPGLLCERQQLLLRQARRRAVSTQPHARGGLAQRPLRPRRLRVRGMTRLMSRAASAA